MPRNSAADRRGNKRSPPLHSATLDLAAAETVLTSMPCDV